MPDSIQTSSSMAFLVRYQIMMPFDNTTYRDTIARITAGFTLTLGVFDKDAEDKRREINYRLSRQQKPACNRKTAILHL
jgi:hypothetical protein